MFFFFFFQAEDGIRDADVTGVQTCALPICGLLSEFDVRGGGPTTRGGSLSGGNQQKVVIAREVSRDPSVLIAAQPTRGLDVGAIEFVHRRLVEQRDAGKAVLLVSLELEEI